MAVGLTHDARGLRTEGRLAKDAEAKRPRGGEPCTSLGRERRRGAWEGVTAKAEYFSLSMR